MIKASSTVSANSNLSISADHSLRVVSAGICCAVGYTAQAASCALRAGMDHFQESEFITSDGQPIRVARLPDDKNWGAKRQSQWITHAVRDCLAQAGPLKDAQQTLLILSAEPERPGIQERQAVEAALMSSQILPITLRPQQSQVWHLGRAGLPLLLAHAHALLQAGKAQQVLLVGFDSYLNPNTINHYLQSDRLLIPGNRDGFIPGEAAAAVLLEIAKPQVPGLHITGWGEGVEDGRPDGSVPSRSLGMTKALRAAFAHAQVDCNDLAFRVSDQNGEGFFVSDAVNAITRVAVDGGTVPMVLTTADCVGEVGAATGPLMIAWLSLLMSRADGPGRCGIVHLANDSGQRGAIVLEYQA